MTLESLNFIEAVTERDIDLLLLEEFHASEEFCDFEEDRDLSDSYSHRLALKQFEKLFIRQSGPDAQCSSRYVSADQSACDKEL